MRSFSAVCYYFGREACTTRSRCPSVSSTAAWGRTAIEPWIGESGLRAVGGFDARSRDCCRSTRVTRTRPTWASGACGRTGGAGTARPPASHGSPETPARGSTCPRCGTGRPGACRSWRHTTAWCEYAARSA
ncbi:MAG: hypothetical protein MZV63_23610 [Marinilabiliales bacterium]|nr:hypothetical protein [Marinilabiliales bacterium]